MTSVLPPVPWFIFAILEPILLVVGFFIAVKSPDQFVADQIASSPPVKSSPNAIALALQLGNIFLLLALLGVAILYTTTERKVVRNYLWALCVGDIGHILATCYITGFDKITDISAWNSLTWGNIVITVSLFLSRILYLAGMFGPGQESISSQNKKLQ